MYRKGRDSLVKVKRVKSKAVGKSCVEVKLDDPINPFALSAAFLNYCIEKGWLIRRQKGTVTAYYITKKGKKELPKLGIDISEI